MNTKKLIQNNSKKLILFFNGWSLDEKIVNHLTSKNYDVTMLWDYSDLEISKEILDEINSYDEINVIAFSFGVWACGCVVDKFKTRKTSVAINGTLTPIDNQFGISEKMFDLTLSNLSEKTYPLFFKNMWGKCHETDLSKMPNRSIEDQRQELIAIKKNSTHLKNPDISFSKVFIGKYDKIIPAKNQFAFWGCKCDNKEIREINSGHYAFDLFKDWEEIING